MSKLSTTLASAILATVASIATLAASTSPAMAGAEPVAQPAGVQSVVVTAAPAERVRVASRVDRDAIAGVYLLADGRQLTLRARGGIVEADLDGHPPTVLRAQGGTTLRSADERMSMQFVRDRDDAVSVTVSLAVDGRTQTLASAGAGRR
jgi:hypothetical protein